jgi:hypothetical protein
MFDWLKRKTTGWKPPQPTGPAVLIRAFGPSYTPIARSAKWQGTELEVQSEEAAIKSLFDLSLPNVDQAIIAYRFQICTDNLKSAVYPQMWCRIPEKGQFFSQGIDRKVSGTHDWTQMEIPFYLEKGQTADLLHLNFAFEGAGAVRLRNIEVTSTPVN